MQITPIVYTAEDISVIIKELQNTPGTNDKKDILKDCLGHKELYTYLTYVYDEVHYVYGKSKLPNIPHTDITDDQDDNLLEMYALVENMNDGILKGNSSDQAIADYCVSKPAYYEELLFYIIKRNIKAGINAKGINEVFGRVIPIAPYQRCESESYMKKRIKYSTGDHNHGAMAQSKADGSFLNCVVDPTLDETRLTTRYGRVSQDSKFLNSLSVIAELMDFKIPMVIHGELLIKDKDGNIMDRATGNGMINKFNKSQSTLKELRVKINKAKSVASKEKLEAKFVDLLSEIRYIEKNMVFEVWDILPEGSWLNLEYSETVISRFRLIEKVVNMFNEYIEKSDLYIGHCELRLIDHKIVYDDEQAMAFYQEQLDAGLEGMVIKNIDATWEHDTNRQGIIKLKDFKENDLIVVGYKMADADSAFAGGIGALIMESSDGVIHTNVSGMKRHDRGLERVDPDDSSKGLKVIDGFDFDQFTGKVGAVKYNEMSKNKQGEYDLFLANILEIRDASDKPFPDDFPKIKKTAKFKG